MRNSIMPPAFLYFDLGNVLLNFDHRLACRQMAEVSGVLPERVWEVVFENGLELRYEAGEVSDREFYDIFCRETLSRPDLDRLTWASSAIFEINAPILPIVAALDAAQYRLGILSNTCRPHWNYCSSGRYGIITRAFDIYALSYEIGACKPDARVYRAAAELAGVAPQEIFFADDIASHVTAACQAGFDSVIYTTPANLAGELRQRGLRFNY